MFKTLQHPWPAQIFFDGQCPLCSRETNVYKRRDVLHRLEFIDIAAPGFDAGNYGLDNKRVNDVMHARTADGSVYTEVNAFRIIWRALPASFTTRFFLALLSIPGMMWLAGVAYRIFARNRYRLTGRCATDTCAVPVKKA